MKFDHHATATTLKNPLFGSKKKTCQNPFYKSVRVVLCKKEKIKQNIKYSRNNTILKIDHYARDIAHAKTLTMGQTSKVKKHPKIHFPDHLDLSSAGKRSKKHQIFKNETILKIGQNAKAIAHAKSSLWVKN